VRPVENGPAGVVAALREAVGPRGTLVMPSWTGDDDHPFDPETTSAATDLGIVAETFRQTPGVQRGLHNFAFAATGPHAAHVLQDPLPVPPHIAESPVGRVTELDGKVLLLGVGHDADTTIHLGELMADVPYRTMKYITIRGANGEPQRFEYEENDHCCQRFALVDEWLRERGLQREGEVGHAHARLARSRDIVRVVREHLDRDRTTFLHPRGECGECDEAWQSVGGRGR
jgi:aminoglycoside 3-N-acetyltransferase